MHTDFSNLYLFHILLVWPFLLSGCELLPIHISPTIKVVSNRGETFYRLYRDHHQSAGWSLFNITAYDKHVVTLQNWWFVASIFSDGYNNSIRCLFLLQHYVSASVMSFLSNGLGCTRNLVFGELVKYNDTLGARRDNYTLCYIDEEITTQLQLVLKERQISTYY